MSFINAMFLLDSNLLQYTLIPKNTHINVNITKVIVSLKYYFEHVGVKLLCSRYSFNVLMWL